MASLVHQLMCTHSPVTVCCVVVCGPPKAEGLTVDPAGRDVVDMVNFLADSEHKRSDVRSTSSARCGTAPQHTTTPNTAVCQHCMHMFGTQHTAHTHACKYTHTCKFTCLQTLFHSSAQSTHFWVALYTRDDVTDKVEGVLCTLLQVQMQELVLLSSIHSHCDCPLVTFSNDAVM